MENIVVSVYLHNTVVYKVARMVLCEAVSLIKLECLIRPVHAPFGLSRSNSVFYSFFCHSRRMPTPRRTAVAILFSIKRFGLPIN